MVTLPTRVRSHEGTAPHPGASQAARPLSIVFRPMPAIGAATGRTARASNAARSGGIAWQEVAVRLFPGRNSVCSSPVPPIVTLEQPSLAFSGSGVRASCSASRLKSPPRAWNPRQPIGHRGLHGFQGSARRDAGACGVAFRVSMAPHFALTLRGSASRGFGTDSGSHQPRRRNTDSWLFATNRSMSSR